MLGRVALLLPLVGLRGVYGGVGEFTKWTQTAAVMEILHPVVFCFFFICCLFGVLFFFFFFNGGGFWDWREKSKQIPTSVTYIFIKHADEGHFSLPPSARTGIVRSPLLTTLLQVSSRLLLVWGIVNAYPRATASSPFYSSMLVAWALSEIVRYSYFVFNLRRGSSGRPKEVPAFLTWARYNLFYVLYPLGIGSEVALLWKASEVAEPVWRWAFLGILLAYVPGKFLVSPLFLCGEGRG